MSDIKSKYTFENEVTEKELKNIKFNINAKVEFYNWEPWKIDTFYIKKILG